MAYKIFTTRDQTYLFKPNYLILVFTWIFDLLIEYLTAHKLGQIGIRVTGSIMDKWVEETDNELIYYVRYSYINNLNTRQSVSEHIFHQLENGDRVTVVYRADQP